MVTFYRYEPAETGLEDLTLELADRLSRLLIAAVAELGGSGERHPVGAQRLGGDGRGDRGLVVVLAYDGGRARFGERAEVAYVLPFSVDGLMVVASVTMVDDKKAGRRPRTSARAAFLAGVLASVGANIAAAHPDLGARIVAGWPALALLLVVEMLSRSGKSEPVRGRVRRCGPAGPRWSRTVQRSPGLAVRSVRDLQETKVEAMTRVFHEALAVGRVPDHRELARAAGADVSHARRVHRRLITQQAD